MIVKFIELENCVFKTRESKTWHTTSMNIEQTLHLTLLKQQKLRKQGIGGTGRYSLVHLPLSANAKSMFVLLQTKGGPRYPNLKRTPKFKEAKFITFGC